MRLSDANRLQSSDATGYFDQNSFPSALAVFKAHGDAAADYLTRVVKTDGHFIYELNAESGRATSKYNILRHAGAILAMVTWSMRLRSEPLEEAISRARACLFTNLAYDPRGKSACIAVAGEAKLGGTALALLAELQRPTPSSPAERAIHSQLATHILAQRQSSGELRSIARIDGNHVRPFVSAYYPWQAILALCRFGDRTGMSEYLDAAVTSARFLLSAEIMPLESVDRDDHWTIIALNELDRLIPQEDFARRVVAGGQRIIDQLFVPCALKDAALIRADYPCAAAATRAEALIASCRLASRYGLGDTARSLYFYASLILVHCTKYRSRSASASLARGGFVRSSRNPTIRIDTVQHVLLAIDGLLALAE